MAAARGDEGFDGRFEVDGGAGEAFGLGGLERGVEEAGDVGAEVDGVGGDEVVVGEVGEGLLDGAAPAEVGADGEGGGAEGEFIWGLGWGLVLLVVVIVWRGGHIHGG